MRTHRDFGRLCVLLPVAATAVLLTGFGVRTYLSLPNRVMTVHEGFKGIRTPGLSPDQVLDSRLSDPGVHGIVRGVVGTPSVIPLPDPDSPRTNLLATNYQYEVKAFLGAGPALYPPGAKITLRVPGGRLGNQGYEQEDAPRLSAGEEAYVFVRDLPPLYTRDWGQNGTSLLVAVVSDDVFDVRNGVVHGQGLNTKLAEPVATFEGHFTHLKDTSRTDSLAGPKHVPYGPPRARHDLVARTAVR